MDDYAVRAVWKSQPWTNLAARVEFGRAHHSDEENVQDSVERPEDWPENGEVRCPVNPASVAVDEQEDNDEGIGPIGVEVGAKGV